MTTMSNLPGVLEDEILSRIPMNSLRSMRSTCKKWNTFSKTKIIGKAAEEEKHSLSLMLRDSEVCSLSFNLQGICNDDLVVKIGIKEISLPNDVMIYEIFHCDGLLLCRLEKTSSLVVWNPYLAQTMWIEVKEDSSRNSLYALGYDSNNKNRNHHKILRILDDFGQSSGLRHEIYRFNSNSWMDLKVTPDWDVWSNKCDAVSLKGNTYFLVQGNTFKDEEDEDEDEEEENAIKTHAFLLCFDFTTESFGPRLPLPCEFYVGEHMTLSCVREEQIALLYNSWKKCEVMEIWITTMIEPNDASWSKFLKVETTLIPRFKSETDHVNFIIDEEKKVAVVFNRDVLNFHRGSRYKRAHIIGEDGYLKSVYIGEAPFFLSSYVPSLVQLQTNQPPKPKGIDCKTKRRRIIKR
ncbi:F-box protein [Cardamine amara subsp. amara]|uniref:F-box protein n=1 Tax=Cardamine amara subsp. amara TaxID=228776 RepID=A0ABD1B0P3_CARAN